MTRITFKEFRDQLIGNLPLLPLFMLAFLTAKAQGFVAHFGFMSVMICIHQFTYLTGLKHGRKQGAKDLAKSLDGGLADVEEILRRAQSRLQQP